MRDLRLPRTTIESVGSQAQLQGRFLGLTEHQLPPMIMDHHEIILKALQTLRSDLDEKLSAFNLLPETFTMKEVQEVYEAIFDRPFVRTNFRKKILEMNVLERLEKKFTGAANKAPIYIDLSNEVHS